jgi:hypothetical protein
MRTGARNIYSKDGVTPHLAVLSRRCSASRMRLPHLLVLLVLSALTVTVRAASPELQWETKGFEGPESVVFDAARQQYYVSNMGSYGDGAKSGDGFIARMSADGKLLQQKWATGLENPKGLAVVGDSLFVGDDEFLTQIDIASGKISAQYKPADGPGVFNDCTADSEGNVYVCSGRLDTVFRLHNGRFEPWAKLDPAVTGSINGLRADKGRLLLGGWSVRGADGKEQVGHISTITYEDKKVSRLGTTPICHIDGLEPDGQGGFTATDWLTGEVFHISAAGEPRLLMTLTMGSADHTYRADTKQLVIPLMKDNVVRAYRWSPAPVTAEKIVR